MPRPSIKGEINSLCSPLLLNCIKKVTVKLVLLSLKDKMEFNHFLIQAVQLKFEINIKGVYMWLKKKKRLRVWYWYPTYSCSVLSDSQYTCTINYACMIIVQVKMKFRFKNCFILNYLVPQP